MDLTVLDRALQEEREMWAIFRKQLEFYQSMSPSNEILHNKKVGRVASLENFETLNPLVQGRRLQFGAAGMDGLVNSGADMGAKYAKEGLSAAGVKGADRLVNAGAAMGANSAKKFASENEFLSNSELNSAVDIGKMGYHTGKNIMSGEGEGLASSGVRTTQEVVFDLVEHDVVI